jgi:hypothetical protein
MKSHLLRFCASIVLLLLASCLSGKEEFWFERDGSGRLEAQYQLPMFAITSLGGEEKLREIVKSYFAKEPGVELKNFSIERQGAQAVLSISAGFDSVLQLAKLLEKPAEGSGEAALPEPMVKLLGEIEVKRAGWNVDFQRRIDPRQVFADGLISPSQSQMKGYQLQYIMHLPTVAEQSNAHETRDDGRTLVWRYELADAMKQPVETNFIAPIPIPPWAWPAMAGVVIVPAWWLWRRRKRVRQSQCP